MHLLHPRRCELFGFFRPVKTVLQPLPYPVRIHACPAQLAFARATAVAAVEGFGQQAVLLLFGFQTRAAAGRFRCFHLIVGWLAGLFVPGEGEQRTERGISVLDGVKYRIPEASTSYNVT